MKNINRFLAAAMLAGFPAFAPEALAQKKRVCVELTDGGAFMRIRVAAEKSKYNTKWSKIAGRGQIRCIDVPRVPDGVKYWAEVKPLAAWGEKLIAKCPGPASGVKYASVYLWGADCTGIDPRH